MSDIQTKFSRIFTVLLVLVLSFSIASHVSADNFPETIPLPNGFRPEGISSGDGTTFYVGSIGTGAVYRGDLRTGEGSVIVPPQAGRAAIGLEYDPETGYLFVAGGPTGFAYVYNGHTGENVAEIQLTTLTSFINDVVVTEDAAYFTNSFQRELYRVPLIDGQLPDPPTKEVIPLSGDFQFIEGAFNANGIDATPNGESLIIVNSTAAALYQVDPSTGEATLINLGGGSVPRGDGILLHGKTLYVVQNVFNQIAVIELSSDFSSGVIERTITSSLFRVPTTIAKFGSSLYVVNARFDTPPTPDTEYEVVLVPE